MKTWSLLLVSCIMLAGCIQSSDLTPEESVARPATVTEDRGTPYAPVQGNVSSDCPPEWHCEPEDESLYLVYAGTPQDFVAFESFQTRGSSVFTYGTLSDNRSVHWTIDAAVPASVHSFHFILSLPGGEEQTWSTTDREGYVDLRDVDVGVGSLRVYYTYMELDGEVLEEPVDWTLHIADQAAEWNRTISYSGTVGDTHAYFGPAMTAQDGYMRSFQGDFGELVVWLYQMVKTTESDYI